MEKNLTKKQLEALRQAAMVEACMIESLNILLSGDRKHEADLRFVLSMYVCSLPPTFKRDLGSYGLWDEYIGAGYDLLLKNADERLPGFRENVEDMLRSMEDIWKVMDEKEAAAAPKKSMAKPKSTLHAAAAGA